MRHWKKCATPCTIFRISLRQFKAVPTSSSSLDSATPCSKIIVAAFPTFSAGVNPLILWKIGDRLIFETEFEVQLNSKEDGGGTDFGMEIANLSYLVNDNLIIGGGLFKTPLGIFNERLESKWVNKLPDRPLPYDDAVGIAQEASVGIFAKGVFGTGAGDLNYAVYVSNGPSLNTDGDNPGSLDFENNIDENDSKAVGGRIGWIPLPYLELGYSIQWAKVNPSGFENVHALTQAVDLSYVRTYPQIKGQIDFRAEWVLANIDNATYVVDGNASRFNNDRNAGYLQIAYRPTQVEGKFLKNLEFIFRYDRLNVSKSAPNGGYEQRYTFGIDYWLNPSTVVKIAYECDHKQVGDSSDAFFIQGGHGLLIKRIFVMNTQNKIQFLILAAGACLLAIFVVGCQQSAGPQTNSASLTDNSTRPALFEHRRQTGGASCERQGPDLG